MISSSVSVAILSASYINPTVFSLEGMTAITVIAMSVMSIVILLHVCMPLNKYRSIVLMGTTLLMGVLFCVDAFTPITILDINYLHISTSCALLGAIIFAIMIPLYFLIGYLASKLIKVMKSHE